MPVLPLSFCRSDKAHEYRFDSLGLCALRADEAFYVTYKEGAEMYRMSEKKFREWSNMVGAAKHISQNKVIVSVDMLDTYLKYA